MRKHGMKPEDLTRLWSTHAAKLAGMQHRKGALAAGMDADIVVRPHCYGPASQKASSISYLLVGICNTPPKGVGPYGVKAPLPQSWRCAHDVSCQGYGSQALGCHKITLPQHCTVQSIRRSLSHSQISLSS